MKRLFKNSIKVLIPLVKSLYKTNKKHNRLKNKNNKKQQTKPTQWKKKTKHPMIKCYRLVESNF